MKNISFRKKLLVYGGVLWSLIFLSSCSSVKEIPKFGFTDGVYNARLEKGKKEKVYVSLLTDSLMIYPVNKSEGELRVDTSIKTILAVPEESDEVDKSTLYFTKHSLDFDLLTFPMKFRYSSADIPPQLGSSLSSALYLGFRGDDFLIKYKKTPFGTYKKQTNHFGHSFGLFFGVTSSDIRKEYTNDQIQKRYSGFSLISGGAFLVSVNNFAIGFVIGIDHLLDENKVHWIYHNKPWLGLTVGMKLN